MQIARESLKQSIFYLRLLLSSESFLPTERSVGTNIYYLINNLTNNLHKIAESYCMAKFSLENWVVQKKRDLNNHLASASFPINSVMKTSHTLSPPYNKCGLTMFFSGHSDGFDWFKFPALIVITQQKSREQLAALFWELSLYFYHRHAYGCWCTTD